MSTVPHSVSLRCDVADLTEERDLELAGDDKDVRKMPSQLIGHCRSLQCT